MLLTSDARVLLIDDAPEIHEIANKHLSKIGLRLLSAFNGQEGLEAAIREQPSVILLDYMMPGFDGLDTLRQLKRCSQTTTIPVIMITAADDDIVLSKAFDAGAVDYVRKPLKVTELQARIVSALKTQTLIATLKHTAERDALTGFYNMSTFIKNINRHLHDSIAGAHTSTLIYVDIDNFKTINDCLGHSHGDRLILETANKISHVLTEYFQSLGQQPKFLTARVGGDGFLLFYPGLSETLSVQKILEHLRIQLSSQFTTCNKAFYTSASLAAVFDHRGRLHAEELILRADIALSAAKHAGRNCWKIFDDAMQERFEHRVALEQDLRTACQQKQFHLVYQPIVSLKTKQLHSVEALLRWDHPELGLVSPSEFIPLAESTGLIAPIGEWCMQAAFEQFARWRREEPICCPRAIHVNLSRKQLLQPSFVEQVCTYARREKLPFHCIHLEVTESEIMSNLAQAIQVLKEMRRCGFKIDIDDFGTGYSSLACLSQFPVDTIKLDRSLIADICTKSFSAKLVELVIKLGSENGITVIAEGIETDSQEHKLNELQCQFAQGFLFARPLHAESLLAFAKSWFISKWDIEKQAADHRFARSSKK